MLKTKRSKNILVGFIIFSMVAMYGYMPVAKAATLTSAKDTISNSDLGAVGVTHEVVFKPGVDLTADTVITVAFNGDINVAAATTSCPSDATENGFVGQSLTCTVVSTLASTTTHTITVGDTVNPSNAGDYDVTISHDQTGGAESSQMLVYIVSSVSVTAHINASLTFEVATTSAGTTVNTVPTTGTSSPDAINFGTLTVGPAGRQTIAQTLKVATNATAGYVVTVQQDKNLSNAAGADIDPYSTSTKALWADPTGLLADGESSYGHIAVTTSDDDNYADTFGAGEFEGLSTTALEIMGHNGPSDGTTAKIGTADVAFSIGITALQEAGDYSNLVTYICTPTF